MNMRLRSREHAFTLVELLVAMAIGLLLTAVVAKLFVGSRQSYATSDDIARMQENVRFTTELLGRTVRLVGYMSAPNEYAVTTDSNPGIFIGANTALTGTDGGGTVSDSFVVQFQGSGPVPGDGTVVDCLGRPVAANAFAINTFAILPDAATNAPGLFCTSVVNGVATAATLVAPYVLNMQVLYGEDTTGDSNADVYVTAGSVLDPNHVVSMRIGLLFRTANPGVRSQSDTSSYDVNGVSIAATNDTFIRRAATMTIALRNRVP